MRRESPQAVANKPQAWEIEAVRSVAKRELRVDVVTGKVLSDRADD